MYPSWEPEARHKYHKAYYKKNKEKRLQYHKTWRSTPEGHAKIKAWQQKQHLKALEMLGGVKCVYCGCDDARLLEINHINGGGSQAEKRNGSGTRFYSAILSGRIPIDDLNVACRVCNARHYFELKYGPLPFTIKWK